MSGTATVNNIKMSVVDNDNVSPRYVNLTISNFGSSSNGSDMDLSLEAKVVGLENAN